MKYYIYILYSQKLDRYYIGVTHHPERRLRDHNNGRGNMYTKRGIPWEMKFQMLVGTLSEARQLEKKLKAMKSRNKIQEIIKLQKIPVS